MTKEMLINAVEPQECRIAILTDGLLEELYVERASSASYVGNIYKGRVTNVESAIQAAFVDFGGPKNGFLHISDLIAQYFPKGQKFSEPLGRKRSRKSRPPIQDCLRRGQELVVQITKEGIGTKGPTLTTYLSIPGRLLVMMPGMNRLGISRKLEDQEVRAKAQAVLAELSFPEGMGFILRTAGAHRGKRDMQSDLNYLLRLWKAVEKRIETSKAPAEIYQESDLVTRTIRDIYNTDIDRIICDSEPVARKVKEFLDVAIPRGRNTIELYVGTEGLFHEYGLEAEIEKIYSRRVELPSGGSLVIDQTEALVAIDINSGRFREHTDAETTAVKINTEAAAEIGRQLRVRDMGGVIIIDFIDMALAKNRHAVEKALRDALKPDRAKTKFLRMSSFGIAEMTRQRVRPALKESIYTPCAYCGGAGLIKSPESLALQVMRNLKRAVSSSSVAHIEVVVTPPVAHHLSNQMRREINRLEVETGKAIIIRADADLNGEQVRITCTNHRGSAIAWEQAPAPQAHKPKLPTVNIDERPSPATKAAKPTRRRKKKARKASGSAGKDAPAKQEGRKPAKPGK